MHELSVSEDVFSFKLRVSILEYTCGKVLSADHKHKYTSAKQLSFPMLHGLGFGILVMYKHNETHN